MGGGGLMICNNRRSQVRATVSGGASGSGLVRCDDITAANLLNSLSDWTVQANNKNKENKENSKLKTTTTAWTECVPADALPLSWST